MGAAESTPSTPPDSHGHAHADGSIHHGHSHSHGGSTTRGSLIPAAMTAQQIQGASTIVPHGPNEYSQRATAINIPGSQQPQWQPVPVPAGTVQAASATQAERVAPSVGAAAGPVVHPDPTAASHTHHHPTAGPTAAARAGPGAPVPAGRGPSAVPTTVGVPGQSTSSGSSYTTPVVGGAPVVGPVSGGGFKPLTAQPTQTLPESGHVQSLKEIEYVSSRPPATTTPGVPMTVVHTQSTAPATTVRPVDVVEVVGVGAAVGAATSVSRAQGQSSASPSVVNPSLLPPSSGKAVVTPPVPARVAATTAVRPAGASNAAVWDQLLRWASPLLPQGVITEWDSKAVSELVFSLPASEDFKGTLQQRQLERKKRRKAQAMEQAEAAPQGRKAPLASPTSSSQPAVVRGQSGVVLNIPYEIASVLLSMDKGLSAMRLQWVPSRVSEDTFFVEYFTAIVRGLHGQVEEREAELTGKQGGPTVMDRVRAIDNNAGPIPTAAQ